MGQSAASLDDDGQFGIVDDSPESMITVSSFTRCSWPQPGLWGAEYRLDGSIILPAKTVSTAMMDAFNFGRR